MKLVEMDDPGFLLPDWVVTKPRLTGICGSDSKQVFMDWGDVQSADNPMKAFFSLPQVLGHEVVADVVALGPEAEGLEVGDRVVLNPWLSCGPRGVSPLCPACQVGDYSLCYSFGVGPIEPGIHIGTSKSGNGGYAELMPAHDSQLFKVPDNVPDELAVFADPFAVSLHSITRHPPTPGGKVMVYGAGALGTCATAILRGAVPRRRGARGRALRGPGRDGAQARRDRDRPHAGAAGHRGGRGLVGRCAAREPTGCRWRSPASSTSCTTPSASRRRSRSATRVLKARGTLVKAGVHGPTFWEDTPLYFKEISMVGSNAFGFEEVDGVRQHGIEHYLDLVASGRIDLTGMLTHTFTLDDWRDAFTTLATQDETGAIKVAFDFRELTRRSAERRRFSSTSPIGSRSSR